MPVTNQWKQKEVAGNKSTCPPDQMLSKGVTDKPDIHKPTGKDQRKLADDPKRTIGVKSSQTTKVVQDGSKNSVAQKVPEPVVVGAENNSSMEEGQLSPGRTKGLAGFWSNQNDEVKVVKKKRFDTTLTEDVASPMVVENTPKRLEGVVRAEDPGEWQKPIEVEGGSARNIASSFQKLQQDQTKNITKPPESEPILRVKTKDIAGKLTQQLNEPMRPKKKKVPTATLR